jgi:hypothetical protein
VPEISSVRKQCATSYQDVMDGHDDSVRLLRDERAAASEHALHRIKRPERGTPMRPRLTIVALLAVGMLMTGTGTSFAFQDFGQSGNDASKAQYPSGSQPPDQTERPSEVFSEEFSGPTSAPPAPMNTVDRPGVPPPDVPPQVERQVEVGSSLPFTGFAAIPVVMLGAALIVTGLALRRRAPGSD